MMMILGLVQFQFQINLPSPSFPTTFQLQLNNIDSLFRAYSFPTNSNDQLTIQLWLWHDFCSRRAHLFICDGLRIGKWKLELNSSQVNSFLCRPKIAKSMGAEERKGILQTCLKDLSIQSTWLDFFLLLSFPFLSWFGPLLFELDWIGLGGNVMLESAKKWKVSQVESQFQLEVHINPSHSFSPTSRKLIIIRNGNRNELRITQLHNCCHSTASYNRSVWLCL